MWQKDTRAQPSDTFDIDLSLSARNDKEKSILTDYSNSACELKLRL